MIRVYPIMKLDQIAKIRRSLKTEKTAVIYALFVVGINTNLRVSDLRGLTWRNVWEDGTSNLCEHINLVEQKTGKRRRIKLTENIAEGLNYLLASLGRMPAPDAPIFRNPLTREVYSREHLSRVIGFEAQKAGIRDPIGMHSLRKTWGFHSVVTFGQPITLVQAAFNHSSQGQTMDYLCITDDQLDVVYETVAL